MDDIRAAAKRKTIAALLEAVKKEIGLGMKAVDPNGSAGELDDGADRTDDDGAPGLSDKHSKILQEASADPDDAKEGIEAESIPANKQVFDSNGDSDDGEGDDEDKMNKLRRKMRG